MDATAPSATSTSEGIPKHLIPEGPMPTRSRRRTLDTGPPSVDQVFDDTDDVEAARSGVSTRLFTLGVGGVLLTLAAVGAYLLIPDIPGRIEALLESGGADEPPTETASDVPVGERAPVWIDTSGDTFEVGFQGPCPDGTLCLEGTTFSEASLRPLSDVRARDMDPRVAESLGTYVHTLHWMSGVGPALVAWHPDGPDGRTLACGESLPGGRAWIHSVNPNARGLVPLSPDANPDDPYKVSDLADDLLVAADQGSRSWERAMRILWPAAEVLPADPMADIYRDRVAAALELGLATGAMPDRDRLVDGLVDRIGADEPLILRLPSEPRPGAGSTEYASKGLIRDLDSLAGLEGRRLDVQLCATADGDPALLPHLRAALVERELDGRITVCDQPLPPPPAGDISEACIAARRGGAAQGLAMISVPRPAP